jgi:hypothetical protein
MELVVRQVDQIIPSIYGVSGFIGVFRKAYRRSLNSIRKIWLYIQKHFLNIRFNIMILPLCVFLR